MEIKNAISFKGEIIAMNYLFILFRYKGTKYKGTFHPNKFDWVRFEFKGEIDRRKALYKFWNDTPYDNTNITRKVFKEDIEIFEIKILNDEDSADFINNYWNSL